MTIGGFEMGLKSTKSTTNKKTNTKVKPKPKNRPKSKATDKTSILKIELYGVLLILIAVFGSGIGTIGQGLIPSFLEWTFRYALGYWYLIIPIVLFAMGVYMMIKRKLPKFLSRRLIGAWFLLLGLLLVTHALVFRDILHTDNVSILPETWRALSANRAGIGDAIATGGGLMGAIIFTLSYFLLSITGSLFLGIFIMLVSTVFILDISTEQALGHIKHVGHKFWMRLKKVVRNINQAIINFKDKRKERKNMTSTETPHGELEIIEEEPDVKTFTDVLYHDDQLAFSEVAGDSELNKEHEHDEKASETSEAGKATAVDEDLQPIDEMIVKPMVEKENHAYKLPPASLLTLPIKKQQTNEKGHIQKIVKKLETTFESFGVKAKVTRVHVGPAVTKYEVYPEAGVKVSKIVNLHDDLALALAAKDLRIEAPIPGKSAVGIEVPNDEVSMVTMREVFDASLAKTSHVLAFVLGRDISGEVITHELNKMPHLLVAGATGSGKSVCINGIIISILMRAKPHEVKLMMIDPKKVELNVYNGIPHLLAPVVTDPKKAAHALKKVVSEMDRRYDLFSDSGNRNIEGYNNYINAYNKTADEENQQAKLPYIVVLVDELADLMMVASNEVEDAITRLAQMARAAGIHLIIATQRPSVDVITGVIKANIPSRIAFSVSSQTDSRTILDSGGAEKLLGRGDMLFMPVGASKPTRIQGAFLSDEEVEKVIDHCIEQQKANYQAEMMVAENEAEEESDDELYSDAVQLVIEMQTASVSLLQRRFRIGYNRAARLIDTMEQNGIVGPHEGSKPRTVLVSEYSD